MPYQIIYASEAAPPMQKDDLEEILGRARRGNGAKGITGALVYAEGRFLQILEGEKVQLQELMLKIRRDVRHEAIVVLQEHEIPSAVFGGWKMAYVSATPRQVAEWAGVCQHSTTTETPSTFGEERQRTARFAQDILALLESDAPANTNSLSNQ